MYSNPERPFAFSKRLAERGIFGILLCQGEFRVIAA
jgi:hypothetical protein